MITTEDRNRTRNSSAQLDAFVENYRYVISEGSGVAKIARKFGVTMPTVENALVRANWRSTYRGLGVVFLPPELKEINNQKRVG